jgi:hypothetical protein
MRWRRCRPLSLIVLGSVTPHAWCASAQTQSALARSSFEVAAVNVNVAGEGQNDYGRLRLER